MLGRDEWSWSGWAVVIILLAGTTSAARAQEPAARGTAYDGTGLVVDYPVFPEVRPPADYLEAIENGTRSEDGRPGDAYRQQQVDYRNDVQINNLLLSSDGENEPDMLSVVAASSALTDAIAAESSARWARVQRPARSFPQRRGSSR